MNPATFELQHSDEPQPKLLDGECATRAWPMPPVKHWQPAPKPMELAQRLAMAWDRVMG